MNLYRQKIVCIVLVITFLGTNTITAINEFLPSTPISVHRSFADHLAALKLVNEGRATEILLGGAIQRSELRTATQTLGLVFSDTRLAQKLKKLLEARIREKVQSDQEIEALFEKFNDFIHQMEFAKFEELSNQLKILQAKSEKLKFVPMTSRKQLTSLVSHKRLTTPDVREEARLILIEAFVNRFLNYEPVDERPQHKAIEKPPAPIAKQPSREGTKNLIKKLALDELGKLKDSETITIAELAERVYQAFIGAGYRNWKLESVAATLYAMKELRIHSKIQLLRKRSEKPTPAQLPAIISKEMAASSAVEAPRVDATEEKLSAPIKTDSRYSKWHSVLVSQPLIDLIVRVFAEHNGKDPLTIKELINKALGEQPQIQTPKKMRVYHSPIGEALEAKSAQLNGLNLSQVATLLREFDVATISRHFKNNPELFKKYGIQQPKHADEALRNADPVKLRGLNTPEAAQLLGLKLRTLANYLKVNPEVRKQYGIVKGMKLRESIPLRAATEVSNGVPNSQTPTQPLSLTNYMLDILSNRRRGDILLPQELVSLTRQRLGDSISQHEEEILTKIDRVSSRFAPSDGEEPAAISEDMRAATAYPIINRPATVSQKTIQWAEREGINLRNSTHKEFETAILARFSQRLVDRKAKSLAYKLHNSSAIVDEGDFMSVGSIALLNAAYSFDADRGIKFTTYAQWRIHGAMQDLLRVLDPISRSMRKKAKTSEDHGLPKIFSMNSGKDKRGNRAQIGEEESVYELSEPAAGRFLDVIDDRELATGVFKRLSEDDRLILILYYYEQLTMAEIGDILDLSEARISQKHREILERFADENIESGPSEAAPRERVQVRKKESSITADRLPKGTYPRIISDILSELFEGQTITRRELALKIQKKMGDLGLKVPKLESLETTISNSSKYKNHPKIRKLHPSERKKSVALKAPIAAPVQTSTLTILKPQLIANPASPKVKVAISANRTLDELGLSFPLQNLLNAHHIRDERALRRFYDSSKPLSGLGKKSRDAITKALKVSPVRSELRLDVSLAADSQIQSELRKSIPEVFNQMPIPTSKTRDALKRRIGLRTFGKSDQIQIVGLLPDLAKLPDLVKAVADNIDGQNRIVVFASGPAAVIEIKNYLGLTPVLRKSLETGEIIVTHRWDADQILQGGIANAQLFLNGLPSDARIANQVEKLLSVRMEIVKNIAPLELLESDLGIAGFSEILRTKIREQFLQVIAA